MEKNNEIRKSTIICNYHRNYSFSHKYMMAKTGEKSLVRVFIIAKYSSMN